MDLSAVADELYGLPPSEFTATRNARASEARDAGETELADALKRLRKPSSGASVANLLVREHPKEIEHLIKLGSSLRGSRTPEGAQIRRATKEKVEIVRDLLRHAKPIAKRAGVPFSQSIEQELETTLDAAFADPDSAEALREGRLTTALRYSGLGFGSEGKWRGAPERSPKPRAKGGQPGAETVKAEGNLERIQSEAKQAASEVKRAERAVKTAEADLQRLRAALTVATRRATKAGEQESKAQKKLDHLRGRRSRS
jgi:hypothetical protein